MRRHLIARVICVFLQLIACRSCLLSRAGSVGSKLIFGVLASRTKMLCRRLCVVGNLLELAAQICVCHQKLLHQLMAGSSPNVVILEPLHRGLKSSSALGGNGSLFAETQSLR